MRGNMKKIAHVLGSNRITADVLTVLRVTESLCGRFSFDVLVPRGAEYGELFLGRGARVIAFDAPCEMSPSAVLRFARYFAANPPDIVHTHVSLSARIGARLAGVRTSISTRAFCDGAHRLRRLSAPIYNFFTSMTLCHSISVRDELILEGVSPRKITTYIPSLKGGIHPLALRRYERETILVCPLPMVEGFGQKTLIQAFSRLSGRINARLVFLKSGPAERECRLLASRLGVGGRVEFCQEEMSTNVYESAECILIFTNEELWEMPQELFSGTVPMVIASDIPQNREIFGETCIYFSSGDAFSLGRVIEAACCEKEKSRRAVTDTARLSLEALCNFYDRLYSSI